MCLLNFSHTSVIYRDTNCKHFVNELNVIIKLLLLTVLFDGDFFEGLEPCFILPHSS